MEKFIIRVNHKKLYLKYLMTWETNNTIVPLMTDDINFALIFEKKEAEKIVNKLSKNYKNITTFQL